jgi:hypothetical protein
MHTCPRFFGRYDFTLSTLTLSLLPILINMGRESYEQDPVSPVSLVVADDSSSSPVEA